MFNIDGKYNVTLSDATYMSTTPAVLTIKREAGALLPESKLCFDKYEFVLSGDVSSWTSLGMIKGEDKKAKATIALGLWMFNPFMNTVAAFAVHLVDGQKSSYMNVFGVLEGHHIHFPFQLSPLIPPVLQPKVAEPQK